jgi:hypothetical protein
MPFNQFTVKIGWSGFASLDGAVPGDADTNQASRILLPQASSYAT